MLIYVWVAYVPLKKKKCRKKKKNSVEICFSGMEALEHMLYQNMLDTSACAMLIPIEVAKNNLFPISKFHEDEYTTYKYYSSVKRVVVTTKIIYYYLQRNDSIMHIFGQANLDELDAADHLVQTCVERWPNLVKAAKSKKFSDYCQVLLSSQNLERDYPEVYKRIFRYLSATKKEIFLDKKARIKNRVAAFLLFLDVRLLKKIYYRFIK